MRPDPPIRFRSWLRALAAAAVACASVTWVAGGIPGARFPVDPGVVSGLRFDADERMRWNASGAPGAVYDVITGFLACMHESAGIDCAVCLANDLSDPEYDDLSVPAAGDGFYYLVRAQAVEGTHGTYDSTTDPERREGRDLEIGTLDCP